MLASRTLLSLTPHIFAPQNPARQHDPKVTINLVGTIVTTVREIVCTPPSAYNFSSHFFDMKTYLATLMQTVSVYGRKIPKIVISSRMDCRYLATIEVPLERLPQEMSGAVVNDLPLETLERLDQLFFGAFVNKVPLEWLPQLCPPHSTD